jgi:hypothetical protein
VSATPEQIAELCERLKKRVSAAAEDLDAAAATLRAQAERVRVLEEALNVIAHWDISDRPLIANEDNIRAEDFPFYVAGRAHAELALISNYARNSVARAALKAAP